MNQPTTKIAFISGHRDITSSEFELKYQPLLDVAIKEGHSFVVGDYYGVDIMAQEYLVNKTQNVKVYHMFTAPRNHAGWPTIGGFTSDEDRDAAMTRASNYDIAWVRPGKEKSGTAQNLKRRLELNQNGCIHEVL